MVMTQNIKKFEINIITHANIAALHIISVT